MKIIFFNHLINNYIDGSVMVFMKANGDIRIVGDTFSAVIIDGCWFSNNIWQHEDLNYFPIDEEDTLLGKAEIDYEKDNLTNHNDLSSNKFEYEDKWFKEDKENKDY